MNRKAKFLPKALLRSATYVLTGYPPRPYHKEDFEEMIQKAFPDAIVEPRVTKRTTVLVHEPQISSRKMELARSYGVETISYNELLSVMEIMSE